MDPVTVLFGTESGNSEMVAEDICNALKQNGFEATLFGMDEYDIEKLGEQELVIVITSTYGEGDLPETAEPFYAEIMERLPDLSSMRFAAFGLGDSSYDTFNLGIANLSSALRELGATQVGEIGSHDASSGLDPSAVALAWFAALPLATRI